MRLFGSPSWQLAEDDGSQMHVLLYVRDVAGLEVPTLVDAPPPLAGLAPRRLPVVDEARRRRVGRDWADWWRALLDVEEQGHAGREDLGDASFSGWAEDLVRVWDAPDFRSLADRPALQSLTVALYPEARQWVDTGPCHPSRRRGRGHIPWATARDMAERIAAERGGSPGAVRGMVMVLDVQGAWWRRVGHGMVLCSTAAAEDPGTAKVVLRDAFEAYLA